MQIPLTFYPKLEPQTHSNFDEEKKMQIGQKSNFDSNPDLCTLSWRPFGVFNLCKGNVKILWWRIPSHLLTINLEKSEDYFEDVKSAFQEGYGPYYSILIECYQSYKIIVISM